MCKHRVGFKVVRTKIADGSWQVKMLCDECHELYADAVNQEFFEMDQLPEYERQNWNQPCARCGHPDTQLHHYFPQAMARAVGENPDAWPTEYLCSKHHDLWQQTVTPGLAPRITNGHKRKWEAPKP